MERIFAQPQYTQTSNEAALYEQPRHLDVQFTNGNAILTLEGSHYTISTEDFPEFANSFLSAYEEFQEQLRQDNKSASGQN